MSKLSIARNIAISASTEKIYPIISDFSHWTIWSPWLIMDPEATTTIKDGGKFYSWEGPRTGSGEMKITKEEQNRALDIELIFIKPWKSKSTVRLELRPQDHETEVTWLMNGSIPFFMFWMKKMMEALVGMDYMRGLNMLKDYIEDGEVHSKIQFTGRRTYEGCRYLGITTQCSLHDVGSHMQADFEKLRTWANENPDLVSGEPFSIYHRWDITNGKVKYTSGYPINENCTMPKNFVEGRIPKTDVYTVTHIGPYRHLGNAWSTQFNLQRSKVFKQNKKIHPFEIYLDMPGQVNENALRTQVSFPMK